MAFMRPGWLSLSGTCSLLVLVGGFGLGTGSAPAQPPTEAPQIEVWQGLKKVTGGPRPLPPTPTPAPVEPSQPTTPAVISPPPLGTDIFQDLRNVTPPDSTLPIIVSPPLPTSMKPSIGTAPAEQEDSVPVADLMNNLNRSRERVMLALAWTTDLVALIENLGHSVVSLVRPVGVAFDTENSTRIARQTTSNEESTAKLAPAESTGLASMLMGPEMLFYAGVLVISPLMFLLGLVIVLKRAGVLSSPVVRIELVGGGIAAPGSREPEQPVEVGLPIAEETAPPRKRDEDLRGLLPPDDYEPQSFDIGPSFEDERIEKENMLQNQAEALLQQVFEQNIRLQQQPPVVNALALAEEIDSEESAPPTPAVEEETTI